MELELQQAICDTFYSYVLIDPLVLAICARILWAIIFTLAATAYSPILIARGTR
jgi:hypothetical protein